LSFTSLYILLTHEDCLNGNIGILKIKILLLSLWYET